MQRLIGLAALAALVGACSGGSNIPGTSYPAIAGAYIGAEGLTFVNAVDSRSGSVPLTVTLQNANSAGSFSGSYVIANGGGSGTIAGTERLDGGISISQFGDPNVSAAQNYAYLQSIFYWCNLSVATSSGLSGSVQAKRFTLTGDIVMPCLYNPGPTNYQTTITFTVVADRP